DEGITFQKNHNNTPPSSSPAEIYFQKQGQNTAAGSKSKRHWCILLPFHNNMPPLPSFSSWDEYFTAFMHRKLCRGSYFDYLAEWNKHVDDENIMAIAYEELKE
ncbi:unnamed protein product, partial [Eretmochelys imbricata]